MNQKIKGVAKGTLVCMACVGAFMSLPAQAELFSTTNAQLLYGTDFDDKITGDHTTDGKYLTLTLEHYGVWEYGDNYMFIDLSQGNYANFDGSASAQRNGTYSEWHPRLSLSKMTGSKLAFGPIKDVYLAGEINRGNNVNGDFRAYLYGASVDLDVPGFAVFGLSVFRRDDNFNDPTYQISPFWSLPFTVGPIKASFDGFVDVSGTDSLGTDVKTQPQLLVDVTGKGKLQVGIEWWYHKNDLVSTSAPQAMVKWTW